MVVILVVLFCLALVQANTETHIIRVPRYFNIPSYPEPFKLVELTPLNTSYSVIFDYPITTKENYYATDTSSTVPTIDLNRSLSDQEEGHLLIRLNNYMNNTYNSDDLLFVKLCWPAIYPMDFALDHRFIHSHQLSPQLQSFDIYLRITYRANYKTFITDYTLPDTRFKVVVEKLPNKWVPIPLEVYDIIVYLVDMLILLVHVLPLLCV